MAIRAPDGANKETELKFSARSEDGSTEGLKRGKGCSCPQEREVSYINYEKHWL